jgi:hypothetical protein
MSLSKYKIDELSPEEIKKLSKSLSFTLWPAVKSSLKLDNIKNKQWSKND